MLTSYKLYKYHTVLHESAADGCKKEIDFLLKNGVKVNEIHLYHGETPLHWAAENGHEEIVKTLIDHEANIEARNLINDRTPLWVAVLAERKSIVEILIRHGAKVNICDRWGKTLLSQATNNVGIKRLLEPLVADDPERPKFDLNLIVKSSFKK